MNNISSSKAERLVRLIDKLKNCQDTRPLSSGMVGSYGDNVDPDEVLYEIRHAYLEDTRWEEGMNFTPLADENVYYQMLDSEFSFETLATRLRKR
jgi:hypothetical protein